MYTHRTTSPFPSTSDHLLSPLTIQVISLPLLCRKYQQTLWYMTDSIAVLEDSYREVIVNVIDLALNWQLFSRCRETTKLCVLPIEQMLNWEYTNFSGLIPFFVTNAEEDHTSPLIPEQFNFFPGLGLNPFQHGHQMKYSFLQWVNSFVTYMAVMDSKGNNFLPMCKYFNIILKAHCEYTGGMWSYYDANYHQRAAATCSKDWSVTDTTLFSQCFTGRAKKAQGCANCSSVRHETNECLQRKGKCQAKETKNPSSRDWTCASADFLQIAFDVLVFVGAWVGMAWTVVIHPYLDCPK